MENKPYDIFKICRSCLKESDQMKPLFVFDNDLGDNISISDVIRTISPIEILEGDGLPDKVCIKCVCELKRILEFRKQIQNSDASLRLYQTTFKCKPEKYSLYSMKNSVCEVVNYDENESEKGIKTDDNDDLMIHLSQETDAEQNYLDENEVKDTLEPKFFNRKQNKKQKNLYSCDKCDEVFSNKKTFTKHEREHDNLKIHKCLECSKEFRCQMYLKVHMRSHLSNEEKPFVCPHCGQQYAYQYQLTQHMYKHTNERPFPCTHCSKGCLTADSLRRHMKIHDANYKKQKHVCHICQKEFSFPSFLSEHMKNHTGEKPFLCSFCGKGFRQKGALKYHIRIHTGNKPYQCEICKNYFMSQGILKVHMRRHTNERPYTCDICGRAFRQSTDMQSHRRRHSGDKPIQCPVCEKRMATSGQLTVHMRIHTGEKPYSCPECNKPFATKTMVVKHIRTHTGEKPYICNVCEKAFSQSSTLNTHLKIHKRAKIINCDAMINL